MHQSLRNIAISGVPAGGVPVWFSPWHCNVPTASRYHLLGLSRSTNDIKASVRNHTGAHIHAMRTGPYHFIAELSSVQSEREEQEQWQR